MANRNKRIQTVIAKDVRDILQFEIRNENIGFLTVTDVDVSSDYSYVKIFVSFIQDEGKNFEKLCKTKGFVRSSLAKKINLRRTPEIEFVLDRGYSYESRIDQLLKKETKTLEDIKK